MTEPAALAFDGVSLSYPGPGGPLPVVEEVSLALRRGEFVGLLGPSGCGKTSLLKLAAGLQRPTAGRVLAADRPVVGPGADRGLVPQEYGVFPWLTVERNVAFGLHLRASTVRPDDRRELVDRHLRQTGLSEFRDALPKTLSGGMRQRVALARAYVAGSAVLLMDEPFGALDPLNRLLMQELLHDLQRREGRTVLLVTHSVEEALYLSARVAIISARPGRISKVIDVPFPFPRTRVLRSERTFNRLKAEIMDEVIDQQLAQAHADLAVRARTL